LKFAEFYNSSGQTDKAIDLLERTTHDAPDFLPAWCLLADIRLARKQIDQAASLIENVLSRDPQNLNGLLLQGEIFIEKAGSRSVTGAFRNVLCSATCELSAGARTFSRQQPCAGRQCR
jgi:Tfp pilus assembly protein PilF